MIPSPALSSGSNISPSTQADGPVIGGPSYPSTPAVRGDVSGSIATTNKLIVHSCDFALDSKLRVGLKKFLKAIAKWVREGIRKIKQLMGFSDPSGSFSEIINMLQQAAEDIRYITEEYIKPIIEFERNASKATQTSGYRGRGIILRISPKERLLKSGPKANNLIISYNEI